MFKLKSLNAALALALGLSFGIATAQTDQPAQQGNALDKPSNKADQQAVGIPAKPGTQSGEQSRQVAQENTSQSEQSAQPNGRASELKEQFAQLGSAPGAGGEVYGWRPSEAMNAQQAGRPYLFNEQIAQRDENKTTGQGQGVRESGGQAGVKTPAQSGSSSAEHFAQSSSAPDAGGQGTTGGA